jgi:2,4-dienoyl-CoA reductase-like NADH-dependent reductase (Old Yellow Enzyme family)
MATVDRRHPDGLQTDQAGAAASTALDERRVLIEFAGAIVRIKRHKSGKLVRLLDYLSDKLSRLADIVRANDAVSVIQTVNLGAKLKSGLEDKTIGWDGQPLWSFSATQSDLSPEVAHPMEGHEVEALIEGWGRAAELITASGIDGIELHGGHGYLLHQSIAPWINNREDEWGQPLRFYKAVLARVRRGLGSDGLLGIRLPSDDLRPPDQGGLGRERLGEIAVELVNTGCVDYLNPTEGSAAWHYTRVVGTYRRPHGEFLPGTRAIREAVGGRVAVLGVGRITDIETAEAALQRGDCDLVGMTRAQIADPDLVQKGLRGESHRIRRCVGANTGCIDRNARGEYAMCFHNPDVGREHRLRTLEPSANPRSVLVVGAGPAGLKAAEIAARRGHRVVLAERRKRIGGRLATITEVTPAHELVESVDWIARELHILEVGVRLETEIDDAFLRHGDFEAIVLATGSVPAPTPFEVDGSVPVLTTEEAMAWLESGNSTRVLVHDALGTEEVAVVIEQLAASQIGVTLTTPMVLGVFFGWTHAGDHLMRLLDLGVMIEERTDLIEIKRREVLTLNQLSQAEQARRFDAVVLGQSRRPELSLLSSARRACEDVYVIGDAESPRGRNARLHWRRQRWTGSMRRPIYRPRRLVKETILTAQGWPPPSPRGIDYFAAWASTGCDRAIAWQVKNSVVRARGCHSRALPTLRLPPEERRIIFTRRHYVRPVRCTSVSQTFEQHPS